MLNKNHLINSIFMIKILVFNFIMIEQQKHLISLIYYKMILFLKKFFILNTWNNCKTNFA